MKIYTKTGDKGMTSLVGGQRAPKNSVRLEAYGTVDELNSCIAMIRSFVIDPVVADELVEIQSRLFDVGGNLATDSSDAVVKVCIFEEDIASLERAIDRMEAEVPPMKHFVLPGGNQLISFCHLARTVCRRAERRILDLENQADVDELLLKYVNRLSDYLFMLSRKFAHDCGIEETKWEARKKGTGC